ncbi:MAG TPA: DUF2007 domain-containing protein [Rhodanobacteraceae bacterium]|jgi:hypothetical protein|nr:DUF2007 domain-containing protein [Rhodanobacteraceae bacterium]
MRVVYHAENIVDAHLVKDALDHAGIPCFINGELLAGGIGQLPARDFLTVSVPDVFVDDAGPVVSEIDAMLRAPIADEADAPARRGEDAGALPPGAWPRPA